MNPIPSPWRTLARLCCLLIALPAGAAVVTQETFDTLPTGSPPPGWWNTPSQPTSLRVAVDPLDPSDHVLATPGGISRTVGAWHTLPGSSAITADVGLRLSFDIHIAHAGDNNWNSRWYLQTGTTDDYNRFTPGYGLYLSPTQVRLHKTAGGGSSGDPGSATTVATASLAPGDWNANGWTRVEFEWLAAGRLRLSLGGRVVATFTDPSPLAPAMRTLTTIGFLNNDASGPPVFEDGVLRYDNVCVSQVLHHSDFDTLAIDANPSDWFSAGATVTIHKVAADPLVPANRVLSTPGGSVRTTGAFSPAAASTTIPPEVGLRLAFDLHIADAGDNSWDTRWYLQGGTTGNYNWFTPGYGIYLSRTQARIQKTSGGGTSGDPGSATTLVTASLPSGAWTTDGWTRVEFVWWPDGDLSLALNGQRVASFTDAAPLASVFRTLSTISFVNNNAGGTGFTDGVLRYDNFSVGVILPAKENLWSLVWSAIDPASGLQGDPATVARALAATGAYADELATRAAEYDEAILLLECIYQWWSTDGGATPAQLSGWLADVRASVELRYAASNGEVDAPWTTVSYVLEILTWEIEGTEATGNHPVLPAADPVTAGRFSVAPAAGVHPRILVSAADMPDVRARLLATACGVKARNGITSFLDSAIGTGKPLRAAWDQLLVGNLNAMNSVLTDDAWWRDQMGFVVCYEAFLALIDQNATRGANGAAALTTYAQITQGLAYKASEGIDEFIGYAYDFGWDYMTPTQRDTVRGIIATATAGKSSSGMNSPASHRRDNLSPHGMKLLLMTLAIEGETGYDATIYPRSVSVLQDYLTYGIDGQGAPLEDMHYLNFGMAKGAPALVAMARRGDNLFGADHYRRLYNWQVHAMEPFGRAFSMHDDTPDDGGGLLPNYVVMKWVWPNDPIVNFVWKNRAHPDYSRVVDRRDLLMAALFPSDWSGADSDPVAGVAALGLPLSWQGSERKLFIARDRWDKDALALHVETNPGLKGPAHAHSNSGDFTLSALGRKWAIDRGYHISESKDHSLILIDGVGQGYFAAPGRWVGSSDEPGLALACVDSRYPYAWAYEFKSRIGQPYRNFLPWEPERYLGVREFFAEAAEPGYEETPWNSPGLNYTYKTPYNPLAKAFRTFALRRATHPYVLVVDDIRKDNAAHTYTWLMQVPDDLEIKESQSGQVVLGSTATPDDRRLLVRMIGAVSGAWQLESYDIANSPETGRDETFGQGVRLKFTTTSLVEPEFRVLLFPHLTGDPLPATTLASSPATLTVGWTGQQDVYSLATDAAGRTLLTLQP
ncbi:hypothetical protein OPIT5_14840 [Opitutaceae bacterium TAV5]|nr:hypothetical protein OPIT5_14840 [Opitutaceae bacterium TAV5]